MVRVTGVAAAIQLCFYLGEIALVIAAGLAVFQTSSDSLTQAFAVTGIVGGVIAAFPIPVFLISCIRHEFEDADDFDSMFHITDPEVEPPNPISPHGLAFMRFFATGGNIIQLSVLAVSPSCESELTTYQYIGLGFILVGSQFSLLHDLREPEEIAKYLFLESGDRMVVFPAALSIALSSMLPVQQSVLLALPAILALFPLGLAGLQRMCLKKSYHHIVDMLYLTVAVFGLIWPWCIGFVGIVNEFCWQTEIVLGWGISVSVSAVGLVAKYILSLRNGNDEERERGDTISLEKRGSRVITIEHFGGRQLGVQKMMVSTPATTEQLSSDKELVRKSTASTADNGE